MLDLLQVKKSFLTLMKKISCQANTLFNSILREESPKEDNDTSIKTKIIHVNNLYSFHGENRFYLLGISSEIKKINQT